MKEGTNSMDMTPKMALEFAQQWLHHVSEGEIRDTGNNPAPEPDACLVIMLCNGNPNAYGTWRVAAGLSIIDTIALLEVLKFRLLAEMHGPGTMQS